MGTGVGGPSGGVYVGKDQRTYQKVSIRYVSIRITLY